MIRHITATEIAEQRPDAVSDIAAILAHTNMDTSEKYYNRAGPHRAVQAFEAMWRAREGDVPRRRRRASDALEDEL
jgi:integrase